MSECEPLLQQWANFYTSMSQAGGTLIGLMFVVITIAIERLPNNIAKIRVYFTPTVVFLATIVAVSELLTIPSHTRLSITLCICVVGLAGLIYSASCIIRHGAQKSYFQQADLIPYAVLPFATYALLMSGGLEVIHDAKRGLILAAAGLLLLLALGIRNSWAIVVDVVSTRTGEH